MRDEFHPDMSVEKMAAWLDGNLSAEEMTQMAEQINADPMLEEVVAMSDEIDSDIEAFEASGEQLPEELMDDDFDLPRTTRWSGRQVGGMFGMVCDAMPACYAEYNCCEEAPASALDFDGSEDEKNLLEKLKEDIQDLFSNDDKE